MNMQTEFLDQSAMTDMVCGFRESEFTMNGFDPLGYERQGDSITFRFTRVFDAPCDSAEAIGMFEGKPVLRIYQGPRIEVNDRLNLTYTIRWGVDDDDCASPHVPGASRKLKFYLTLSNAV